MMQSVSTLIIGSGAATEVSFLNFCMASPSSGSQAAGKGSFNADKLARVK